MSDPSDANLQLKKRARRRLVGAVAFAGLAAVVLPMVMDEEPKQQIQDVQIRIPGQEQTLPAPKAGKATAVAAANEAPALPAKPEPAPAPPAPPKVAEKPVDKTSEKAADKPAEKAAAKSTEKAPEKAPEKPAEKPAKPAPDDARKAAAILAGKAPEATHATPAPAAANGQFVILIGAFSNPGNVKQLQSKLGELGVKVFTEPLDTPEGKKTRVRAGPFANREAADKALEKMKRIGVNGIVSARQ